jgi:hypothetical protein
LSVKPHLPQKPLLCAEFTKLQTVWPQNAKLKTLPTEKTVCPAVTEARLLMSVGSGDCPLKTIGDYKNLSGRTNCPQRRPAWLC